MAVSNDYLQYVLEQLSGLDHVRSRRMFSGWGLYCGELFFGLIFGGTLYFKVDDSNRPDYELRGMSQFRPYANKPRVSMSYYEVPVGVLEDGEQLVAWATKSVTVAESAPAKARPRQRKKGRKKG
jgi:DNA transformation protein and related proteins